MEKENKKLNHWWQNKDMGRNYRKNIFIKESWSVGLQKSLRAEMLPEPVAGVAGIDIQI